VNRLDSSIAVMRDQMGFRKFLGMAVAGVKSDEPVTKMVSDEIINAYRRYGKPLFLFTPNGECVQSALEIARGFPMLKVVFLGMGGDDWRTAIAAAHASTNVLLETSGAMDRAKLPAAIEAIGAHRILFGSGSPRVDAAAVLGLVHDSALSEDARRKILCENANKLFGLAARNTETESE
jgi:predicted TIM-barrel fold metal-dependent hydrolase